MDRVGSGVATIMIEVVENNNEHEGMKGMEEAKEEGRSPTMNDDDNNNNNNDTFGHTCANDATENENIYGVRVRTRLVEDEGYGQSQARTDSASQSSAAAEVVETSSSPTYMSTAPPHLRTGDGCDDEMHEDNGNIRLDYGAEETDTCDGQTNGTHDFADSIQGDGDGVHTAQARYYGPFRFSSMDAGERGPLPFALSPGHLPYHPHHPHPHHQHQQYAYYHPATSDTGVLVTQPVPFMHPHDVVYIAAHSAPATPTGFTYLDPASAAFSPLAAAFVTSASAPGFIDTSHAHAYSPRRSEHHHRHHHAHLYTQHHHRHPHYDHADFSGSFSYDGMMKMMHHETKWDTDSSSSSPPSLCHHNRHYQHRHRHHHHAGESGGPARRHGSQSPCRSLRQRRGDTNMNFDSEICGSPYRANVHQQHLQPHARWKLSKNDSHFPCRRSGNYSRDDREALDSDPPPSSSVRAGNASPTTSVNGSSGRKKSRTLSLDDESSGRITFERSVHHCRPLPFAVEHLNKENLDTNPAGARYFVIKAVSEDDVHRAVKRGKWMTFPSSQARIDAAYQQASRDKDVYLFFSVNGSSQFCGVARVLSAGEDDIIDEDEINLPLVVHGGVSESKHASLATLQHAADAADSIRRPSRGLEANSLATSLSNAQMTMTMSERMATTITPNGDTDCRVYAQSSRIEWLIVKDVPNTMLKHIIVPNNDFKSVTISRDMQEILPKQGNEMLRIMHEYTGSTSILDDYFFYEARRHIPSGVRSILSGKQRFLRQQAADLNMPFRGESKLKIVKLLTGASRENAYTSSEGDLALTERS